MATRSTIARVLKNGTVKQVYCHFDGYLDGVGKTLKENYTDTKKLDKLLKLGDLSTLGPELGRKHRFDNPYKYGTAKYYAYRERNKTTFYARDRGETGTMARTFKSVTEFLRNGDRQGFDYIMLADSNWYIQRANKFELIQGLTNAKEGIIIYTYINQEHMR